MKRIYVFGVSVLDLGVSLIAMLAIFAMAWRWHFRDLALWPFMVAAVLLTIPVGILFHVLFGVNTQINWKLGLSYQPKRD
jgi:hypothetical protein